MTVGCNEDVLGLQVAVHYALAVRAGDFFYTRPETTHRMIVPEGEYLLQYVAFLELDTDRDADLQR